MYEADEEIRYLEPCWEDGEVQLLMIDSTNHCKLLKMQEHKLLLTNYFYV